MADTGDTRAADAAPRAAGVSDSLFRLGGTVVAMLRTRLELATVEFEEERERATELLLLVVCSVLLGLFALLFASLFVIAWYWDSAYRMWAIGGVTLFYVALAAVIVLRLQQRRRDKPTAFAATLSELGHDVSALRRES
ncbi:MAG: phage holin family protein [Betaproteobacteria bacterium]